MVKLLKTNEKVQFATAMLFTFGFTIFACLVGIPA